MKDLKLNALKLLASSALAVTAGAASADQLFVQDVIVQGSLCVGVDCVNGESFGFDTIILKENNLRIKFNDTSASSAFPNVDWQLTANETSNGGLNKFSIDDISGGRTPVTILAGAPTDSLFVHSTGRLGLGTSSPGTDIDIKTGNSPTLRLQQDGSAGFAAQTWDVAGNETNFFIRDVTNASNLPLRIRANVPTDAIELDTTETVMNETGGSRDFRVEGDTDPNLLFVDASQDNVGIGTNAPAAANRLEIVGRPGEAFAKFGMAVDGAPAIVFNRRADELRISDEGDAVVEFIFTDSGNLTIAGTLTTGGGTCGGGCDRVFSEEYDLPTMSEHHKEMFALGYLPNVGPTAENEPINVSDKLGRMLNELEHAHIYIAELNRRLSELESKENYVE